MSIFRSAKMSLWQLFLPIDGVYQCISGLGELGLVEFRDLNPNTTAFMRPYTQEVRRCEEMERKLRYVQAKMSKADVTVDELDVLPLAPAPKDMVDMEASLDKMDAELREVDANYALLKQNALELTELRHVLLESFKFLEDEDVEAMFEGSGSMPEFSPPGDDAAAAEDKPAPKIFKKFNFVTGCISVERAAGFERMLFRVGRGNIFYRQTPIETALEDHETGAEVRKVVFICFYQGEQLRQRVKKVCDGYHASLYPCPESAAQRREMEVGVATRIHDLEFVIQQSEDHRRRLMQAAAKSLKNWFVCVRKVKGIFHTMNMLSTDLTKKCVIAECWVPSDDIEKVRQVLSIANSGTSSAFEPIITNMNDAKATPPTYFRTNKFTKAFQAVVNAYGLATYREVNPGLYTIATFPFLFAVMFGDAGHGILLTMLALWMIIKEDSLKKIKGEVWNIFFGGRYMILMMSVFSIYTGLIYNDIFSKSMNIFGSSYVVNYREDMISTGEGIEGMESGMLIPESHKPCSNDNTSAAYNLECGGHYRGDPYWFGIDPVWQFSENKIVYLNSYKMKLAVIIAVLHMTFGIFLNLWNYMYFKQYSKILVEFLPRILFFWPLFGYLMFLMFYKWVLYGGTFDERPYQSDCAPSILLTFINMMLLQYGPAKITPTDPTCGKTNFFFEEFQKTMQIAFVLIALLSVPVLLFGSPIIYKIKTNKKKKSYSGGENGSISEEDLVTSSSTSSLDSEEETSFGDVMIYQAIHTIEFVLECVSHTASYLRLWALSLAHSQLSEVLWSMVFRNGLKMNSWVGGPAIFVFFAPWAILTAVILIAMEGMSAFLHTLRLHWVEFQSKFYHGEGIRFQPFNFKHVEDDGDDE